MKKILTIAVSSLLFFSCADQTTEHKESEGTVTEEHHHHDESEAIELNDGAKWKVDENMMVFLNHMKEDASDFKGETLHDHKVLAEHLNENIDELTSNCTMEGKAHDELHKWLIPYIALVDNYLNSETLEDASAQYSEVVSSFKTFDEYFE